MDYLVGVDAPQTSLPPQPPHTPQTLRNRHPATCRQRPRPPVGDGRLPEEGLAPFRGGVVRAAEGMRYSWDRDGILLGSRWDPHGIVMGSSSDSRGILMGSFRIIIPRWQATDLKGYARISASSAINSADFGSPSRAIFEICLPNITKVVRQQQ